jgi:hypothetical protein
MNCRVSIAGFAAASKALDYVRVSGAAPRFHQRG